MSLFDIIDGLSKLFVLFPIAISINKYSSLNKDFKLFFWFLLLYAVFNVISWYTSSNGIHNLPIYHAITLVEFASYSLMYYQTARQDNYRKTILLLILLFTIFCVLNALFFENIHTDYNSNTRAVGSLILLVYSVSYFYRMLKELSIETVEQEDMFWFNTAILIYFSGTFFLSLFLKVFFNEVEKIEVFREFLYQIYYLQFFLYAILNLLLAKAIWVSQQSK